MAQLAAPWTNYLPQDAWLRDLDALVATSGAAPGPQRISMPPTQDGLQPMPQPMPQPVPPDQGPGQATQQAPSGPGYFDRLAVNPMFHAGLAALGTQPGGNWGPNAASAAQGALKQQMAQQQAPVEEQYKRALISQAGAHGRYYDQAAKAQGARAGASAADAATRRLRAYSDMITMLGPNPTQEAWDAENQPGGFIHAGFGRSIPYPQAPFFLAQARKAVESQFNPTPEEETAGISAEDKKRAFRQQRINDMWNVENKTLVNKGVRLTPGGAFEPIPGSTNTVADRQARTLAKTGMSNLEEAERFFANPGAFGSGLAGYTTQGAGQLTGQGESGRAFKAARMGIIDMVFALSGKQVSNKEREEFLGLYQPQAYDTQKMQLWKLQRAKTYFQSIMDVRERGGSEEEVGDLVRRAIQDGAKGPDGSDAPKMQGRLPAGNYRYNPSTGRLEPAS